MHRAADWVPAQGRGDSVGVGTAKRGSHPLSFLPSWSACADHDVEGRKGVFRRRSRPAYSAASGRGETPAPAARWIFSI